MRKTRFTDEQVAAVLKGADREAQAVAAKRHSVSELPINNWLEKFGLPGTDEAQERSSAEVTVGSIRAQ